MRDFDDYVASAKAAMTTLDYKFKLYPPPWEHQAKVFLATADQPYHALFMEQRTGKTRVALDTAAYLYETGKIDAAVIVAPNGVHRQWIEEEAPKYIPDHIPFKVAVWSSSLSDSKVKSLFIFVAKKHPSLFLVSLNIDALRTKRAQEFLRILIKHQRFMLIIDESLDIGNPKAERSKIAIKLARRAAYRRILDGTPLAAGPLGLHNQAEVLKPHLLGTSYVAYRARYAILERVTAPERPCKVCNGRSMPDPCRRCNGTGWDHYEKVTGYQNLEELEQRIKPWSTRILRSECHDLPPKIYARRVFDLTPRQRAAYDELRETYRAEIAEGQILSASHALTRYLRLQQISSNRVPTVAELLPCPQCAGRGCDACDETGWGAADVGHINTIGVPEHVSRETFTRIDESRDPRLDCLLSDLAQRGQTGAFIVWARFASDVDLVTQELDRAGYRVGRYDGLVSEAERSAIKLAFQEGDLNALVGSSRAGGRGLDLSRADTIYYYSHDWSLRARLQSEDRGESLMKRESTAIVDLVASDTLDDKILAALKNGKSLGQQLLGDPKTAWF